MLRYWNKLVNTDCKVALFHGKAVYPIFKNGSTSLFNEARDVLVNHQIKNYVGDIQIYIRDPEQRFVSGVNEYSRQNNLPVMVAYQQILNGDLIDRHFAPQWIWLFHLFKYHRGNVTLRPFSEIGQVCRLTKNRSSVKVQMQVPEEYVSIDEQLIGHIGQTLPLEQLVRSYKHVLS